MPSGDGGASWSPVTVVADGLWRSRPQGFAKSFRLFGAADLSRLTMFWTSFVTAGDKNHDVLFAAMSADGGLTWSAPVSVPAASADVPDTQLSASADGLTFNVVTTDRINPDDLETITSHDGGRTWTEPVHLTPIIDKGLNARSAMSDDGRTIVVAWRQYDTLFDRALMVSVSRDSGSTFSAPHELQRHDEHGTGAPRLVLSADGKEVAVFWDRDSPPLMRAGSSDAGATWSAPVGVDGYGDIGSMTASATGKHLVRLNGYPARISDDGGLTWRPGTTPAEGYRPSSSRDNLTIASVWSILDAASRPRYSVVAASRDGGDTWTPPRRPQRPTADFADAAVSADGSTVMAFAHDGWRIWAETSADGGATWRQPVLVNPADEPPQTPLRVRARPAAKPPKRGKWVRLIRSVTTDGLAEESVACLRGRRDVTEKRCRFRWDADQHVDVKVRGRGRIRVNVEVDADLDGRSLSSRWERTWKVPRQRRRTR